MKYHKRDKRFVEKVVTEYVTGNNTYQEVSKRYCISVRTLQNWVNAYRSKDTKFVLSRGNRSKNEHRLPEDVKQLQNELCNLRLHNMLLEELLDIGQEQYGLDLRKKNGAKQS